MNVIICLPWIGQNHRVVVDKSFLLSLFLGFIISNVNGQQISTSVPTQLSFTASSPFQMTLSPVATKLNSLELGIVRDSTASQLLTWQYRDSAINDPNLIYEDIEIVFQEKSHDTELQWMNIHFFALATTRIVARKNDDDEYDNDNPDSAQDRRQRQATLNEFISDAFADQDDFTELLTERIRKQSTVDVTSGLLTIETIVGYQVSPPTSTPSSPITSIDPNDIATNESSLSELDIILIVVSSAIFVGVLYMIVQHHIDQGYFENRRLHALNGPSSYGDDDYENVHGGFTFLSSPTINSNNSALIDRNSRSNQMNGIIIGPMKEESEAPSTPSTIESVLREEEAEFIIEPAVLTPKRRTVSTASPSNADPTTIDDKLMNSVVVVGVSINSSTKNRRHHDSSKQKYNDNIGNYHDLEVPSHDFREKMVDTIPHTITTIRVDQNHDEGSVENALPSIEDNEIGDDLLEVDDDGDEYNKPYLVREKETETGSELTTIERIDVRQWIEPLLMSAHNSATSSTVLTMMHQNETPIIPISLKPKPTTAKRDDSRNSFMLLLESVQEESSTFDIEGGASGSIEPDIVPPDAVATMPMNNEDDYRQVVPSEKMKHGEDGKEVSSNQNVHNNGMVHQPMLQDIIVVNGIDDRLSPETLMNVPRESIPVLALEENVRPPLHPVIATTSATYGDFLFRAIPEPNRVPIIVETVTSMSPVNDIESANMSSLAESFDSEWFHAEVKKMIGKGKSGTVPSDDRDSEDWFGVDVDASMSTCDGGSQRSKGSNSSAIAEWMKSIEVKPRSSTTERNSPVVLKNNGTDILYGMNSSPEPRSFSSAGTSSSSSSSALSSSSESDSSSSSTSGRRDNLSSELSSLDRLSIERSMASSGVGEDLSSRETLSSQSDISNKSSRKRNTRKKQHSKNNQSTVDPARRISRKRVHSISGRVRQDV